MEPPYIHPWEYVWATGRIWERIFRPTVHPVKEHEFEAFLRDTAVPLVSRQAGPVEQHVGKPRDPSSTEYV
jgi:hypothetical protein